MWFEECRGFWERKGTNWEGSADESEKKTHRNCLSWFPLLPVLDIASWEKYFQTDFVSKIDI